MKDTPKEGKIRESLAKASKAEEHARSVEKVFYDNIKGGMTLIANT